MKNIEIFLRSTVFNIFFFGVTAVMALSLLPTALLPRRVFMGVVWTWVRVVHVLERLILNLDYEVRGLENLPRDRTVIIAAKHQSAYETFKLHVLFNDPAIVLKRELLRIPVWGLYLSKIDPIAINRSDRGDALRSLITALDHVKDQHRPIIIFPQGTRVKYNATPTDKPYKGGVARMALQGNIPIVPLAMNTGLFWPKLSWIKRPGRVIFEFLPPIAPEGTPADIMHKLQSDIEGRSNALMDEAREKSPWLPQ